MKRRFNYTGRKRIPLDRIEITVNRKGGVVETFHATIKLDNLDLPHEAAVYVEAYHRSDIMRYCFGTVGEVTQPLDTSLTHLAHVDQIRFRVLVVDGSNKRGVILASADRLRPLGQYEKHSILPVDFRDLGRQVWKLEYGGDEPILAVNSLIPNIHNLVKTDARFHTYIYPAVVREIFTHMLFIDGADIFGEMDDLDEWQANWCAFAKRFLTEEDWATMEEGSDSSEKLSWIERLVQEFCLSQTRDWQKLIELEEVG